MPGPATPDPVPPAALTPDDLDALLEVAVEAARAAGEAAMGWWARGHGPGDRLQVEEKTGPGDLVSQADRDAEQAIRDVLARRRPDDAVLGEETGSTAGRSGVRWVVDPVDGTTNYVYGRTEWCVSVAAVDDRDGRLLAGAVLEPAVGDRLTAARLGGGTTCDGHPVRVRRPESLALAVVELGLGRAAQRRRAG
ncbi:MAG: inositol monophosphatase, partial [Actinomycetota bacterium]|nr:inositol monophosphatase [Actinomycetota bacterium]